ncbi:hypothetical protein PsorP6_005481 [Peronosclerospora sorghi]|uniref:Uncharacterized protein n=1 Tax=Peronosclerospora sorghi TaxID=230839 RepID=A0ACC0W5E6_9STRA|nr:hypothetical protein PsorP6_005481 [Peronosclerospora sorghi]
MDEERTVLLGSIQTRQSADNSSPYVSKAGGTPAWYSDPPPEAASMTCPKCNKSLFLVAQIYAPFETDRTLYVFGCNTVSCTEVSGSWRVLRDQIVKTSALVEEKTMLELAEKMQHAWDLDSNDSDWSNDEYDSKAQDPAPDLEALLQQRDDAMNMKNKIAELPVAPTIKVHTKVSASSGDQRAFPALLIDVIDEPYEDYKVEHNFAHENRLLEEYMKQEEQENDTEIGELRKMIKNSTRKRGEEHTCGARSLAGESYEKTPAGQRHLLRFQKRISRYPMQCLRYDYGGEPLWPVAIPQELKAPRCPGCGQERYFELQLTPTINYFLKVDEFATADASTPGTRNDSVSHAPEHVMPPGGMEWLSLLVYSCSASCSQSHEEFIYVVPST